MLREETREEMEKRMHKEYLERKNRLIKKIPGILHGLAMSSEDGEGMADIIAKDNMGIIIDILRGLPTVKHITPKRFRGGIQECLMYPQNFGDVVAFLMKNPTATPGLFNYDFFWIDIESFVEQTREAQKYHCMSKFKDDCASEFVPNVSRNAPPPIVFGKEKYLTIAQPTLNEWWITAKGLPPLHSRCENRFTSCKKACEELMQKEVEAKTGSFYSYDHILGELLGKKYPECARHDHFEPCKKPNPGRLWRKFPSDTRIDYCSLTPIGNFHFYFLFGSIYMVCDTEIK